MTRRAFDIIFSILVLFFSIPIFILAALIIKLDSKGTIFFKQKRVGKDGKLFEILKFRTMANTSGAILTASGDKRITPAGRILRRTNFDEIPQFINILKNQMSVVGPRPEIPEIVKGYTKEQRKILTFKPGFTSFATVKFLNEENLLEQENMIQYYIDTIMPQKITCDLEYFQKRSNLFQDLIIILKTLGGTLYA